MRIAIVFSSPTPSLNEFENVWKTCPESRELGLDKLVIEGDKWKVFAFDGLSRRYYSGTWNLETLNHEITAIMEEHTTSFFGILLHGFQEEMKRIIRQILVSDVHKIYYTWCYASLEGTFYKRCIKPFSNEGSDALFEKLWTELDELEKTKDEECDDLNLKGRLIFISHRLLAMIRSMRMVVEDAKENIVLLQDFRKFDFEFLSKGFETVESKVMNFSIPEIEKAREMITDIQKIINEISPKDLLSLQDLNLGCSCLEKAETLHDILEQASEVIHD